MQVGGVLNVSFVRGFFSMSVFSAARDFNFGSELIWRFAALGYDRGIQRGTFLIKGN